MIRPRQAARGAPGRGRTGPAATEEARVRRRSPEEERQRALAAALRALGRRALSTSELRSRLESRELPPEAITAALERVAELGYLEDAGVAESVQREGRRRHYGSRRVARTLARRGITGDVATRAVRETEASDLEGARALLAKRFPAGIGEDRRERARALRLLLTRGYPQRVARIALGVDFDVGEESDPPELRSDDAED